MVESSDRLRPVILKPDRGSIHLREMLRHMARLERTDGLTLPELLIECESELSSETTLLIILQTCDEQGIAALIGLSRRGREIAVLINTHDINDYSEIAGPLIAEKITTLHLSSEESSIRLQAKPTAVNLASFRSITFIQRFTDQYLWVLK